MQVNNIRFIGCLVVKLGTVSNRKARFFCVIKALVLTSSILTFYLIFETLFIWSSGLISGRVKFSEFVDFPVSLEIFQFWSVYAEPSWKWALFEVLDIADSLLFIVVISDSDVLWKLVITMCVLSNLTVIESSQHAKYLSVWNMQWILEIIWISFSTLFSESQVL